MGQLVPDKGLVKVYPPHVGVVVRKVAVEGQLVDRGDTLFEIADEVRSIHGSMFAAVSQEMESRRMLLKDERAATVTLQDKESLQAERKSEALQRQLNDVDFRRTLTHHSQ